MPVDIEGIAQSFESFLELERALIVDPHFANVEPVRSETPPGSSEVTFQLRFLYDPGRAPGRRAPRDPARARGRAQGRRRGRRGSALRARRSCSDRPTAPLRRARRERNDLPRPRGALLVVNVAISVLYVRPKVVRYRQLTDLSSPQLQVVKSREQEVVQKESYRIALVKARDDMKHLAGDVLSTRQRRMIGVQLEIAKLAREFGIALDRVRYETEAVGRGRARALRDHRAAVGRLHESAEVHPVGRKLGQLPRHRARRVGDRQVVRTSSSSNITLATYFIAPDANLDELGKKPAASVRSS